MTRTQSTFRTAYAARDGQTAARAGAAPARGGPDPSRAGFFPRGRSRDRLRRGGLQAGRPGLRRGAVTSARRCGRPGRARRPPGQYPHVQADAHAARPLGSVLIKAGWVGFDQRPRCPLIARRRQYAPNPNCGIVIGHKESPFGKYRSGDMVRLPWQS